MHTSKCRGYPAISQTGLAPRKWTLGSVDTSAMTPGLGPTTVAIDSRGTMSLDGGQTFTTIDFTAANQQVVDGETGAVLHVDSTGIGRTGTDVITYEGTHDLFAAAIAIRDTMLDGTLDQATVSTRLNARLDDIDHPRFRLKKS